VALQVPEKKKERNFGDVLFVFFFGFSNVLSSANARPSLAKSARTKKK
jgi:hypothetical protein